MKLIRREELTGALAGQVELEATNERGKTVTWITTIGSDSDVMGAPTRRPIESFESHVEEMNARVHFKKKGTVEAQICRELHDKTGKVEKAWRARGGKYGRVVNRRGNVVTGPILSDRERPAYVKVWNEIRPRGQMIHEA